MCDLGLPCGKPECPNTRPPLTGVRVAYLNATSQAWIARSHIQQAIRFLGFAAEDAGKGTAARQFYRDRIDDLEAALALMSPPLEQESFEPRTLADAAAEAEGG